MGVFIATIAGLAGGIAIGDLNQLPIFTGPGGAYVLLELDVSDAGRDVLLDDAVFEGREAAKGIAAYLGV